MPTRTISGKRLSKIASTTYDASEAADAFAAMGEMKSIEERIAEAVEWARAFLAARGLPGCARLFRSQRSGEYSCVEPEPADRGGGCYLDKYVLTMRGFERDSPEHIAARMICAAAEMRRPERGRALQAALEIGQLSVLAPIYEKDSLKGAKLGAVSKRRWWGDVLAERIDGWDDIPESFEPMVIETDQTELTIYRDGNEVCCKIVDDRGERSQKLARSTFKKNYLRKRNRADSNSR